MANRELKTKIKLRYDLLANWTEKNPELLAGEIAIVAIPSGVTEMQVDGSQPNPPQILFKVGPGKFNDLSYASAKAADVYGWAKAASKPTYTAAEVGLGNVLNVASYSKDEIDSLLQGISNRLDTVDTNTTYEFEKTDKGFKITPSEGEAQTISFEYLTEQEIKNLVEGYGYAGLEYVNGELAKKVNLDAYNTTIGGINEALTDINADLDTVDGEIKRIDGAIEGINGSITGINNKFADYYTKDEADAEFIKEHQDISGKADKSYVDEELGKKADTSYVNEELAKKVKVSDYNTKMQSLDGLISSLNSDKVNNSDFEAYKTEADNKFLTSDEVDAHINEVITDAVEGDALTSLTELVSYINTHGGEATEMATAIENIEKQLDGIDAGTGTVKKYVDDVVAALKIGDYAKASDLLAAVDRITVNEQDIDELVSETIPGLESRIEDYETSKKDFALKSELFSGSYNDLKDKPNLGIYETIENVDKVRADVKSIKDDYLKGSDKTDLSNAISTEKGRIDTLVKETLPTLATKAEVSEAITNSHKHDNQAILNATTASFTTELKTKYDGYESSINDFVNNTRGYATKSEVESVSNRVKVIEDDTTILRSTDVFIWDCGGAE